MDKAQNQVEVKTNETETPSQQEPEKEAGALFLMETDNTVGGQILQALNDMGKSISVGFFRPF